MAACLVLWSSLEELFRLLSSASLPQDVVLVLDEARGDRGVEAISFFKDFDAGFLGESGTRLEKLLLLASYRDGRGFGLGFGGSKGEGTQIFL